MTARGSIRAFGAPFDISYSSCSNLKPTLFDWVDHASDINVFIDYAIIQQSPSFPVQPSKIKVGWLCESISIYKNLYEFVKNNYVYLFGHVKFIFTSDKYLLSLDPRFKFCHSCSNVPWTPKSEWGLYKKSKVCSMICSQKKLCEEHIVRQSIAEKNKSKVDLFGGFLDSPYTGEKFGNFYKKGDALKDYMFSIVVQNNFNSYFFTEILTDCFAYGTIPIFLGNKEIFKFFDEKGILIYNNNFDTGILNEELYNSKILGATNNLKIIHDMPMSDDYLYNECVKCLGDYND